MCIIEQSSLITCPHGFSTRLGGVSSGIFTSLNLGVDRGDSTENVRENWHRFLAACGISGDSVVFGKQIHGNCVHIAGFSDARDFSQIENPIQADGYVTDLQGLPIAVSIADCVPVLLQDKEHGIIAALHCGWRPTVADIIGEGVKKMVGLGADPSLICAAIGPAIDQCCFEVGGEVIEAVQDLLGSESAAPLYFSRGDKFMLDLRGVVTTRLLQTGLKYENIEKVGACTMCHPDRYFSHRYTKGQRGSMFAVIMQ